MGEVNFMLIKSNHSSQGSSYKFFWPISYSWEFLLEKLILHTKCKTKEIFGKTYNCSDIGNVLNEQQNPLSVGLSANNSVHLYLMPNQ